MAPARRPTVEIIAIGALLLLAPPARAQAVRGELVDGETGRPVAGAMILLRDAGERTRNVVLTDEAGRFLVAAPGAGTYLLRAERIGYASTTSDAIALSTDTAEIRFAADPRAISLEGFTVRGRGRCVVRPREGLAAHALWEEARKALDAVRIGEGAARYRFLVRLHERELDRHTLATLSEEARLRSGPSTNPFASVSAETLTRWGFADLSSDEHVYHVPDAAVLLSDPFLDTHCFRPEPPPPDSGHLVGLAFDPVGDRGIIDIRGVLWLDRRTSELRRLEYRYAASRSVLRDTRLGGVLEFERLPSGAWIVGRWHVRMPRVTEVRRSPRRAAVRMMGIEEDGGEVVAIATAEGAVVRSNLPARNQHAELPGEPDTVSFPSADGGVVAGLLWGAGQHAVVLVPGGRFGKGSWSEQAPLLAAAGLRVLAVDHRGRGETVAGSAGPEAIAHDVLGAVRWLRGGGATEVSVVGGSIGGWGAAEAAVSAPGEIARLVLLAASAIDRPDRLRGPILFVLAREDAMGEGAHLRLPTIREQYTRAGTPKELLLLEGDAHAQALFETEHGPGLLGEIIRFLTAPMDRVGPPGRR